MNKHVSKLLQPGVFWYCLIMLAFTALYKRLLRTDD